MCLVDDSVFKLGYICNNLNYLLLFDGFVYCVYNIFEYMIVG